MRNICRYLLLLSKTMILSVFFVQQCNLLLPFPLLLNTCLDQCSQPMELDLIPHSP